MINLALGDASSSPKPRATPASGPRPQRRHAAIGEAGPFPLEPTPGAEGQAGPVGRDDREIGFPAGSIHQPARARPSGVAPRVEAGGVPGRDDDPKPAAASLQHHETLSGDQLGYERRDFFRPLQHRDGARGDQGVFDRPPRLRRVESVREVLGP